MTLASSYTAVVCTTASKSVAASTTDVNVTVDTGARGGTDTYTRPPDVPSVITAVCEYVSSSCLFIPPGTNTTPLEDCDVTENTSSDSFRPAEVGGGAVGVGVTALKGADVGAFVVGRLVGEAVGTDVGESVGLRVGVAVGESVGETLGWFVVGAPVGALVGAEVGA